MGSSRKRCLERQVRRDEMPERISLTGIHVIATFEEAVAPVATSSVRRQILGVSVASLTDNHRLRRKVAVDIDVLTGLGAGLRLGLRRRCLKLRLELGLRF